MGGCGMVTKHRRSIRNQGLAKILLVSEEDWNPISRRWRGTFCRAYLHMAPDGRGALFRECLGHVVAHG